jgi:spermidine synthase
MWLPFSNSIRWSKQNGWIIVTSKREVWVKGIKQTSARYAELWADALAHGSMLQERKVSNVLMLGLGGGGALPAIHKDYPECHITAVEFDPAMVSIAKTLQGNRPYPFPKVILQDAKEALAQIEERYDLILVDIFNGAHPSSHIDDDSFWELAAKRLEKGGVIVLNVAIDSTRHYTAEKHFERHLAWTYGGNVFCALANS